MTFVTLLAISLSAPPAADQPADPAATQLLADTRTKRAAWDKSFPGFTSKLIVNTDGVAGEGTIQVDADGSIELTGIDSSQLGWVKPLLKINIDHRLPSIPTEAAPCRFGDDVSTHPLGREVILIGDGMGSRYRIRDGQIMVVNREGPGPRFTTTVLTTSKTPEEKYLPTSFVITFWSPDGTIHRTAHHSETFTRIGNYDLPAELRVVSANKDGVTVRTVKLINHQLTSQ